jgi:hypothetical protein
VRAGASAQPAGMAPHSAPPNAPAIKATMACNPGGKLTNAPTTAAHIEPTAI